MTHVTHVDTVDFAQDVALLQKLFLTLSQNTSASHLQTGALLRVENLLDALSGNAVADCETKALGAFHYTIAVQMLLGRALLLCVHVVDGHRHLNGAFLLNEPSVIVTYNTIIWIEQQRIAATRSNSNIITGVDILEDTNRIVLCRAQHTIIVDIHENVACTKSKSC